MLQKYQPLNLIERLQSLRNQKFTGLICFQSSSNFNSSSNESCFVSFRFGEINYAGAVAPNVDAIAAQLTDAIGQPFFAMGFRIAREQCKGSNSPQEVLAKVVSTRIVTWEKIENAMQSQAESVLIHIAQAPGVMTSEAEAGSDLRFGEEGHGLNWEALQAAVESALGKPARPVASDAEQAAFTQTGVSSARLATENSKAIREPKAVSTPLPQPPTTAAKPTVLSVDDSPIVQKMIQRALDPICNLLLADNALLALQLLNKEEDIALVLLDVNMPGISGLDFCRTIRGIPKFKQLPIVMLTANEGRVSKAMGQIAGSTLYLNKPVDDQKLISVVQQYTQAQGAQEQEDPIKNPALSA